MGSSHYNSYIYWSSVEESNDAAYASFDSYTLKAYFLQYQEKLGCIFCMLFASMECETVFCAKEVNDWNHFVREGLALERQIHKIHQLP